MITLILNKLFRNWLFGVNEGNFLNVRLLCKDATTSQYAKEISNAAKDKKATAKPAAKPAAKAVKPLATKISESSFGYRLQGKTFLLTYSQVKDAELKLFVDTLTERIGSSFPLESFTATCELHKDGGRHFHVVLTTQKRINTTDAKLFDNLGIHPNVTVVRSPKKALEYILKSIDKNFTGDESLLYTSFEISELKPFFGVYKENDKVTGDPYSHVFTKLATDQDYSVLTAMSTLSKHDAPSVLKNYKKLFQNLVFIKSQHATYEKSFVDFFRFDFALGGDLMKWIVWDYRSHVLCLMGPTRIGKTTLALQLGGKNPLVINEINGLVFLIPGHHTSIIFNDFNFAELKDETLTKLLAIFDLKTPATIRILFQSIYIPAYLPKIVTSNVDLKRSICIDDAIEARLKFVYLSNLFRIDRAKYPIEVPKSIPCAYDKDKKYKFGSAHCVSSAVLFSMSISIRKEIKLKRQFDEFKRVYPKKITYTQSILIKSLNKMYYLLSERFPKMYTFANIYDAFQYYTILNKPKLDLGSFIYKCSRLYKHYTFESETPELDTLTNIFDLIFDQQVDLDTELLFNLPTVTKTTKTKIIIKGQKPIISDDFLVADPFFSSLRPPPIEDKVSNNPKNQIFHVGYKSNHKQKEAYYVPFISNSDSKLITDGLSDILPSEPLKLPSEPLMLEPLKTEPESSDSKD